MRRRAHAILRVLARNRRGTFAWNMPSRSRSAGFTASDGQRANMASMARPVLNVLRRRWHRRTHAVNENSSIPAAHLMPITIVAAHDSFSEWHRSVGGSALLDGGIG